MAKVSGTFSGTGQSSTWCAGSAVVILDFGTGTVAIEVYDDENANWVAVSSKTADYAGVLDGYGKCQARLNCTAHSADIDYCVYA